MIAFSPRPLRQTLVQKMERYELIMVRVFKDRQEDQERGERRQTERERGGKKGRVVFWELGVDSATGFCICFGWEEDPAQN